MSLVKMKYKKYPKLVEAMENRYIMYNDTLEYIKQREKEGNTLVIRPKECLNIGKTEKNPEELKRVYEIGRRTAEEQIEIIRKFIEK